MYSFDVFDTLITRTTATPKGIFALMQEELLHNPEYKVLPDFLKENFYYIRTNAEALAGHYFRHPAAEEITIEQIYDAVAMNGSLSPEDKLLLIQLEKKTEINNAIAIPSNIDIVKKLLNKGEKVILISDMYLDYDTVYSMLMKADPVFEKLTLYLSSEIGKCKGGMSLYRHVRECENTEYDQWVHMGDNVHTDVKDAGNLGIRTELFEFEALTPYEQDLINKKEESAFVQLTVGAARNARLLYKTSDAADIGCSLGGTVLFPYVWWVIQNSISKGIRRLYFIARDGYILKKIADLIINDKQYDIETYYIYGSRRAWRMASVSERNNDIDKFLIGSYINNASDAGQFADIFQVSLQDLAELIPVLSKLKPDQELSPVMKDYLIREIRENKEDFIRFLSIRHKNKRNMILDYIRQEIDFERDDFAFVELAGSGLTQGCLAEILRDSYQKPIRTFFFKLDCVRVPDNCIFYDYFPSYMYLHITIEMLARAPHGQTIGYRKEQDKIVPILEDFEDSALKKHGYYDYVNGVEYFTKAFLNALGSNTIKAEGLQVITDYMRYITGTPDKRVMDFIGGMPNNVTGREVKVIEYAPVLSNKELREIYLVRTWEPVEWYYPGTALDYSILRSGRKAARKIEFYQKQYHKLYGKAARLLSGKGKARYAGGYEKRFPYEILEDRVILYGAGKVGTALYKEIIKHGSRIVQWVDAKYPELQSAGLPVASPGDIGKISFDQIIIAMLNGQQAAVIKEALLNNEVPKSKIIWMNLRAG